MDDEEGWTPVMKRKTVHEIAWSESSTSDSEVDVSCSRKVEYEKTEYLYSTENQAIYSNSSW